MPGMPGAGKYAGVHRLARDGPDSGGGGRLIDFLCTVILIVAFFMGIVTAAAFIFAVALYVWEKESDDD